MQEAAKGRQGAGVPYRAGEPRASGRRPRRCCCKLATTDIEDMQCSVGNEQLVAIKGQGRRPSNRASRPDGGATWPPKRLPFVGGGRASRASCRRSAGHAAPPDQIEAIRTHRLPLSRRILVAPIRWPLPACYEAVNGAHMPIMPPRTTRRSPRWRATRTGPNSIRRSSAGILAAVGRRHP